MVILACSISMAHAQSIIGVVIDADSKQPITYATVVIEGSTLGGITDNDGVFKISSLEVGRYDLEASCVGYKTATAAQVLVYSGKQAEIKFELESSALDINEVVVTPRRQPDKTINNMGGIAARSLMIDDAKRLAGSLGDPARLAANFAGVATGNLQDNGLVIRGNSSKGVLWRVEGVEVFNPNHMAGGNMAGGGFVNIFGSNLLGNSDFYSGAFPSEYGNATSGVFDINFRSGNSQTREHFAQVGILGVEAGSEGYFKKGSFATYNIGARVSSLGTIGRLAGGEAPDYQDLSLKINIPTKSAGTLSIWGMGGLSSNYKPIQEYQEEWTEEEPYYIEDMKYPEYESDWLDNNYYWRVGAAGIAHKVSLGERTFLKTDIATSGMSYSYISKWYDEVDDLYYDDEDDYHSESKYTVQSVLNHRFGSKFTTRTGVVYDYLNLDYSVSQSPQHTQELVTKVNTSQNTWFLQAFTQGSYSVNRWLTLNGGLHLSHFGLTGETVIEPRASIEAKVGRGHTFGFSYGQHSQREELKIYFSPSETEGYDNTDLALQRSEHFVFTYNWLITDNLRFKIEPYYQRLHNVPVDANGGYFSMVNYKKEWLIERDLVSSGSAENIGVDLTLERFFSKGWYFMLTGSVYDSKYIDGDGIERNSRYNRNLVGNAMAGKEFIYSGRKGKSKVLGVNLKISYMGGEYSSPLLMEESLAAQTEVLDYSKAYSVKNPASVYVDASFYLKTNHKNGVTTSWILDMKNVTLQSTFNGYRYNYVTEQMDEYNQFFIMPQLAYRIEF